ncbi:hypothetical protein ACWEFJ_28365 [Actinosynnema sp. NPDC004786]
MSTARLPVSVRVGTGTETVVGSVRAEPVEALPESGPVPVRIAGGALAVAELLEQVATELRRRHAEQTTGHAGATVLLAANRNDARRYRRAHPDRWTDIHIVEPNLASRLRGTRVHSVAVTEHAATATRLAGPLEEALEVLTYCMEFTPGSIGGVTYLRDVGDGGRA